MHPSSWRIFECGCVCAARAHCRMQIPFIRNNEIKLGLSAGTCTYLPTGDDPQHISHEYYVFFKIIESIQFYFTKSECEYCSEYVSALLLAPLPRSNCVARS